MGSDAEYMYENNLDPFHRKDQETGKLVEWEGGLNPAYEDDYEDDYEENCGRGGETSDVNMFDTFEDAKAWAKENPGRSIIKSPDGNGYVVNDSDNVKIKLELLTDENFEEMEQDMRPIKIHFETFECAWKGNLIGQMHCSGSVDVSINNARRRIICFNNSLQKSSSDPNLMMTLRLFDSSHFDEVPTAQVSLFRDGNIKAERQEVSGETISVPLENLSFYLEFQKNMGSLANNDKPLDPDTIAYNNSLEKYKNNSDVKEFELMLKCMIGDTSERSYVTVGQVKSMKEVFNKASQYGERIITGQIDQDQQKAHFINHVGAMFLASKNDNILLTKLAKAFRLQLFDSDFMEVMCDITTSVKYTSNNKDDFIKNSIKLHNEIFHPVLVRASNLDQELAKEMGW